MSQGPSRRDVTIGAAAVVAYVAIPIRSGLSPSFAALQAEFDESLAAYRNARVASVAARSRIMSEVRETDIMAFFQSPEIRARSRARQAATAAAQSIIFPEAVNDADAALQDEALRALEDELGGSVGVRERFSSTRRIASVST